MQNASGDAIEYQLAPEELAVLVEIDQQVRALQQQAQGAIRMLMRTRALSGNWRYETGKLVKVD